jgi:hypothetical protein
LFLFVGLLMVVIFLWNSVILMVGRIGKAVLE